MSFKGSSENEWEGWVEFVASDEVRGWVWRVGSDDRIAVELLAAGEVLAHAVADEPREDLRNAGKGDGHHGFRIRGTLSASNGAGSDLSVRVAGSDVSLPRLDVPSGPAAIRPEAVQGFVDVLYGTEARGWACNPESDERLEVELVVDGAVVASTVADQPRADLLEAGKGDGMHGFVLSAPASMARDADFVVRVIGGPDLEILSRIGSRSARESAKAANWQAPVKDPRRPMGSGALPNHNRQPGAGLDAIVLSNVYSASDPAAREVAATAAEQKVGRFHAMPPLVASVRGPLLSVAVPTPEGTIGLATGSEQAGDAPIAAGTDLQNASPHLPAALTPDRASGAASASAGARGSVLRIEGGRLVGWAVLETGQTAVLVVIDGKVAGEVEATGVTARADDPAELGLHGFSIVVPAKLLDGSRRRVTLYAAQTGMRIPLARDLLPFAEAPQPRQAPAVEDVRQRAPVPPQAKPTAPAANPATAATGASRSLAEGSGRVAVVAWDMAHNPVGRAFLLADMAARRHRVELVGPIFSFYGGRLWGPITDAALPIRGFPASDLKSLVTGAVELARTVECDVVHIGKPRLSSLLIGALIRQKNDCPMVVDVDDHELSFTKDHTPATWDEVTQALEQDPLQIDTPYSDLWTRFCETLLPEADGITVSNVALGRRFGGITVRHGRDEKVFDPIPYDRRRVRAEFGYTDADRVVLFLGTPRPHKGVFEVADALERLADDRLALCVIGSINDKRVSSRFAAYKRARIALHPDQPWQRLPELVNLADAAMILQDPAHPISDYQIPAKLTDALALDVPVFASGVPPLADLALTGAFETVTDSASLEAALRRVAANPPRLPGNGPGRSLFLTELSYDVNRARLDLAYAAAARNRRRELPVFDRLFRLLEKRTGVPLPRLSTSTVLAPRRRGRLPAKAPARDMVFLWKQNDSDVYGRRSDMIAKYLLQTGSVRRVLHFDAPMSTNDLERQAAMTVEGAMNQGNLVYVNSVRRILRTVDTPNFVRRTFLHRTGSKLERAFGVELPPKDAYPEFIRDVLREVKADEAPLLWVCPVVFDYPAVAQAVRPGLTIADIIDDQRTFPGSSEVYRKRVADAYETILAEADVVFSNCEPVRDAFAQLRPDIAVVPNGAELFPDIDRWAPAVDLEGLARPVIGYVGNLRDRVDFQLVEATAERFPKATIVLVGSAHGRPEVAQMAARWPNMRLLGVRPYDEAKRIIRDLDVAIMPHLKNEQSHRMNPLKLYLYFALGVPIVTTDVANIGEVAPYVDVADDTERFLAAVGAALEGKGRKVTPAVRKRILEQTSWTSRVKRIWGALENGA